MNNKYLTTLTMSSCGKSVCLVVYLSIAISQSYAARVMAPDPDLERAFYYNNQDQLLQIEDLDGVDLSKRTLTESQKEKIKVATDRQEVNPSAQACVDKATQTMDPSAKYAVYWGLEIPAMAIFAKPLRYEKITGADKDRVLKCPPPPDTTCTIPPHICVCYNQDMTCKAGCCR